VLERQNAALTAQATHLLHRQAETERALAEAREQQTATSDVLQALAASPADVTPVFSAILGRASRLCSAAEASILRLEGEEFVNEALRTARAGETELRDVRWPTSRTSGHGRVLLERRTIHIPDVAALTPDAGYSPGWIAGHLGRHLRVWLGTPLLREDTVIGALVVARAEHPFTDQEIRLLETFAAQAAVAREHARLLSELQERLAEQTATAEIVRMTSGSPGGVQQVLEAMVESAGRLCDTRNVAVWRVEGAQMRLMARYAPAASEGAQPGAMLPIGAMRPISRESVTGRAVADRRPVHIPDMDALSAEEFPLGASLYRPGSERTMLVVPLLRDGEPTGAIAFRRPKVRPFTEREIALLETFANQAAIAIEHTRLFQELEDANHTLREALERQTATAQVLQLIAASPADLPRVLQEVIDRAARLCGSDLAAIWLREGDHIRIGATYGETPELQVGRVGAIEGGVLPGAAMVEERTIHFVGVDDSGRDQYAPDRGSRRGPPTLLLVPLMSAGGALGVMGLGRSEIQAFSPDQIALVESFASQAVIALENTRFFTELQERTHQLARSVEQLTALGEVTQTVTSTLDLQEVLSRIAAHAQRLSGSDAAALFEFDEGAQEFRLRVTHQLDQVLVDALRGEPLRLGEGAVGQAAAARAPVEVPDILIEGAYESRLREPLAGAGFRALLAVPLLREDRVLGGLVLNRKAPGAFPGAVVDLIKTFAAQSALAIHNARLFRELEEKRAELEVASRHKSEFLAAMSHELRTPLNAVIGFSEVLLERLFGDLNEKQAEYLGDILDSGRHLLALINDILDLSKVEAGRMELESGRFALPETLEAGLSLLRERAARHNVALSLQVHPALAAAAGIEADERKVKQVLFNLLSNAVKFTPDGGRVEVSAHLAGSEVVVAVKDSGIGIAPADQERIFEAFQQAGQGPDQAREGTGLGLPLARQFVELHGGRLWVESAPGQGSTFTFTLPVAPIRRQVT
jgi:signal transduction histidine kinase